MSRNSIGLFLVLLALSFLACSNGEEGESETLAKVNDYNLSLREFKLQLAQELKYHADFKLTREAKEDYLKQLIQEELLIQEAKRLKLDRKEKFVRAIERYWKSTLIRDLLESKAKELKQTILVSQEEIEACYAKMKDEGKPVPPLAEMQCKISEELKERKTSRSLKEWMADLKKKADIEINQELLFKD